MRIAVTGGAGYIGSHTTVVLLEAGHDVLILDNFANAEEDVPDRVAGIAGRAPEVVRCDVTEEGPLRAALEGFAPDAVIHFAGLKAVGDSTADPLEYYRVNVGGSITLFRVMQAVGCGRVVFSSSATVYGAPDVVPTPEDYPLDPASPYGQTKAMVEEILRDWGRSDGSVAGINLRYFNPVGAHPSARIGELPRGVPNNLMPYIAQVAGGQRERLTVFGDDYDTPDGTGVRDYIHVMDLARAHLAALDLTGAETGVRSINVGTGRGYSVLEMIRAFEAASGIEIPFTISARRPGDVPIYVAKPTLAHEVLGWRADLDLEAMCRDAWAWEAARTKAG